MRRTLLGALVGVTLAVALAAVLAPFRDQLGSAPAGLVLVLPVVAGVILGGFLAGAASVVASLLAYAYAFTSPHGQLGLGSGWGLVALVVYVLAMLPVARIVAHVQNAHTEAQRLADETHRLFQLSELLVQDRSIDELLETIARAVCSAFGISGVALLVPDGDRLRVAASAGAPLTSREFRQLDPASGLPVRLGTVSGSPNEMRTVALTAADRPVGILAMRGAPVTASDRALLGTFANHAALALERARLREQALRSQLLEEIARLRNALMGAVSHDLRTPLASMKVASSALLDPAGRLDADEVHDLHLLLDVETDRLTRLVTSLLDLSRFNAGQLELHVVPASVGELATDTLAALRPVLGDRGVRTALEDDLPDVLVDRILIGQALGNLLDNAHRHAPPGSVITITGERRGAWVELAVSDRGPEVRPEERETVFDQFTGYDTGGRAGLGPYVAKTLVEAHGGHIRVEDNPGGGVRLAFTLPSAAPRGLRTSVAASTEPRR